VINAPLEFELKSLDSAHAYLTARGLKPETINEFGLGYCNRGLMKDRVAIPLHDPAGRLVGYAGRLVDDAEINADTPKYLLPGSRVKDGVRYEFHKSELLFNGHRINAQHPDGVDSLVVVEGFFGAMRLHQAGFPAVALMGAACSEAQARLLLRLTRGHGRIFVMPDGDDAGTKCALSVVDQVCGDRMARWVRLSHKQEPDAMEDASIEHKLADCGW
jgi:DNA primase